MTQTLTPARLAKTLKPQTPLAHRLDWPIHGVPQRYRAQECTTADDRSEAARILIEYRRQEQIVRDNNIAWHAEAIAHHEHAGRHVEAEEMRRAMGKCDHAKFVSANEELRKLTVDATDVVIPILDRLLAALTVELDDVVRRREEELQRLEIPLFTDREDVNGIIKNGVRHHFIREWALHQPREIKLLHSMREVVRHLREKFDNPGNYTSLEIRQAYSIQFLQFACTDEDVRFEWL